MKVFNLILVLFIGCLLFSSCQKNEDEIPYSSSIIGKWKLIATYADPGDGSGKFRDVNSNKILEFDSTQVQTNTGSFCNTESNVSYTLSEIEYQGNIDKKLKFGSCDATYSYTIVNNMLTIYFNCIEGCGERYKRIN